MTDLLRYAEPMCGWPHDADICEHGLPATVCALHGSCWMDSDEDT